MAMTLRWRRSFVSMDQKQNRGALGLCRYHEDQPMSTPMTATTGQCGVVRSATSQPQTVLDRNRFRPLLVVARNDTRQRRAGLQMSLFSLTACRGFLSRCFELRHGGFVPDKHGSFCLRTSSVAFDAVSRSDHVDTR